MGLTLRYRVPKVRGGLLSLELWMSLSYTISLRIPWNILEGSMTFHSLLWPSMGFYGINSQIFQNFPELSRISIMFHNVLWHSMTFHKVPWTSIWPSVHLWGSLRFPVGYPEAKWSFWDIIHKSLWLSQGSVLCTFAGMLESMNSAWSLLAVFRAWGSEYIGSV